MLTPRQAQLAFVPLMVTAMSGIISLTMTLLHHGFAPGLTAAWLYNWAVAFVIALPTAWVVVPGVRTLLARLTRPPAATGRQLGDMG